MDHGLQLVGAFRGVKPVTRGNGDPVDGMFAIVVDISREGSSREFTRRAVFFDTDQDTGEETRISAQVGALSLSDGDRVAVRVTATGSESKGRVFVNFNATDIEVLDA